MPRSKVRDGASAKRLVKRSARLLVLGLVLLLSQRGGQTAAGGPSFNGTEAPGTTVAVNAGSDTVAEEQPPATLIVKNHVINNSGGLLLASNFTMTVTGSSPAPASFAGSETGTTVTLSAGSYGVDEDAIAGYAKSFGAGCAGTIASGETKTCTITNDDLLPGDALPFSNGYLVTGGYVEGFVDLQQQSGGGGFVSGTINISGVPPQADILAAWLYWETIVQDTSQLEGVQFRTNNINVNDVTIVKKNSLTLTGPFASCWASNGQQPVFTMYQMKADVRRLLPLQLANGVSTGKRLANGAHTVRLPENGTGNHVPQSAGASLVVVYRDTRDPNDPDPSKRREPLRKIVFYDGISVLPDLPGAKMSQNLRGIYASETGTTKFAKITHLGGSGQPNGSDKMFFLNRALVSTDPPPAATPISSDVFGGTSSASDRSWTNKTIEVTGSMPGTPDGTYGETVGTIVNHTSGNPYDCLAWGAVIFETTEADVDQDGLPDGLENAVGGLKGPDDNPMPNLNAMGANSTHPDIFIEMDALKNEVTNGTLDYGSTAAPYDINSNTTTVANVSHTHMPTAAVAKGVIDALKMGTIGGVAVVPHLDAGNAPASYYNALNNDPTNVNPHVDYTPYFVPSGLAKGGDQIQETKCGLSTDTNCRFKDFPGTVGWQLGFNKYAALYFDKYRNGLFHWIFYVHANGRTRQLPCLDTNGVPTLYNSSGQCTDTIDPDDGSNPNFYAGVPTTQSGIAQLPGGKVMVSVGLWDKVNHVGTTGLITGTTIHELGHNLDLYHGGFPTVFNTTTQLLEREPQCKPDHLSVMSYAFQIPGLLDNNGVAHYEYSRDDNADLFENNIVDGNVFTSPALRFRTAWFAPLTPQTSFFASSKMNRFCNGLKFGTTPPPDTVRIDGPITSAQIDWKLDGIDIISNTLDVNFDGVISVDPKPLRGFNDWDHLRLDQVGGGKGAFGFSAVGEGGGGTGDGGGGTGDSGGVTGDSGGGTGDGGGGTGDSGGGTGDGGGGTGDGGGGTGDSGGGTGDSGGGTGDSGGVEVNFTHYEEAGHAPPNPVTACVIGTTGCVAASSTPLLPLHRTFLTWVNPPGNPTATHFFRWRDVSGQMAFVASNGEITNITLVSCPSGASSELRCAVDNDELPNGQTFFYMLKVDFGNGGKSGGSVPQGIVAVNNAPDANVALVADPYTMLWKTTLTVPSTGNPLVLANDTDVDSPNSSLKALLVAGSLSPSTSGALRCGTTASPSLCANGAFNFTPAGSFFGTVTFRYKANDGTWTDFIGSVQQSVPMSPDSGDVTVTIQVNKK